MARRSAWLLVLASAVSAVSCSGDDAAAPTRTAEPSAAVSPTDVPSAAGPDPLPIGKSDLSVAPEEHASPEGFRPPVRLVVTDGWTSVHRDIDGFDFGMPDPDKDAPLVAVVFLTPSESSAAEALAAVGDRANGTVRTLKSRIGSIRASGLDITGGHGELVTSANGGIALDAAPGQRLQVLAGEVDGAPLLVVILVPDAKRFDDTLLLARGMLDSTRPL